MGPRANVDVSPADTARAMERVLRAERDAELQLAAAREEAQALVEAAREQALARVNRALGRIARWQHGHALALDSRLRALKAQADAAARARPVPEPPQLAAAVERVAARIAGADPGQA